MDDLQQVMMVCEAAAAGELSRKVFSDLTRGASGVKGLKMEDFEKKYTQLKASPLLRRLEIRQVREGVFRNAVAEAIMAVDCEELEAVKIASLLEKSRQNASALPGLFLAATPYLPAEKLVELDNQAKVLYPDIFQEAK